MYIIDYINNTYSAHEQINNIVMIIPYYLLYAHRLSTTIKKKIINISNSLFVRLLWRIFLNSVLCTLAVLYMQPWISIKDIHIMEFSVKVLDKS